MAIGSDFAVVKLIIKFNDWLAVTVTRATGSMWCAYAFAALAFVAFPGLSASPKALATWLAQTFIQLVMLSVILVGQNVIAEMHDKLHQHLGITNDQPADE